VEAHAGGEVESFASGLEVVPGAGEKAALFLPRRVGTQFMPPVIAAGSTGEPEAALKRALCG
jgi:hypothetical protein